MNTVLCVALLSVGSPRDVGVDGGQYLEAVRDAQRANDGRYPQGEIRARLKTGQFGPPTYHNLAECHLIWMGDKIWTELTRWGRSPREIEPKPGTGDRQEWILDRSKMTTYHPGGKRVIISPIAGNEPPLTARMTPAVCWYGPLEMVGFTWAKALVPNSNPRADPTKVHFTVKAESGDLIEVLRHDDHFGSDVRMVFSLSQDGNVVEYEIKEPSSQLSSKGTCQWERDSRGRLYLKKSHHEDIYDRGKESIRVYKTYETEYFDPDYRADPARFELKSLRLPRGTMINDEVAGRNRRVGDGPVQDVVDRLGPLIETMRSRGFASDKSR